MIEALLSGRWIAVWRRNYLVWRKLAAASIAGNIIDPLFYLLGFGLGFATMIPEVEGVKYIAFLAGGTICYTTMLAASFEALYSGFARMHVQRTWEGIMNAPVSLEDVVLAEWIWAASKSLLSGTAILLVAIALGLSQSWTMVLIVPLAFLIGLSFAGMGLVMTAIAKSYDFFTYWFTLVLTPQMLLCGVFFPIAGLPSWVQAIASALPLTHAIAIGRPLFLGQWPQDGLLHAAVLAAWGVAGFRDRAAAVAPALARLGALARGRRGHRHREEHLHQRLAVLHRVRERVLSERGIEGLHGFGQRQLELAIGRDRAAVGPGLEALGRHVAAFGRLHHLADVDVGGREGEGEPAAAAARVHQVALAAQEVHDLREVVLRDVEGRRDAGDGGAAFGPHREVHEDAQAVVGEGGEAHMLNPTSRFAFPHAGPDKRQGPPRRPLRSGKRSRSYLYLIVQP